MYVSLKKFLFFEKMNCYIAFSVSLTKFHLHVRLCVCVCVLALFCKFSGKFLQSKILIHNLKFITARLQFISQILILFFIILNKHFVYRRKKILQHAETKTLINKKNSYCSHSRRYKNYLKISVQYAVRIFLLRI